MQYHSVCVCVCVEGEGLPFKSVYQYHCSRRGEEGLIKGHWNKIVKGMEGKERLPPYKLGWVGGYVCATHAPDRQRNRTATDGGNGNGELI